jgi:K+-sensing histidine kinase KdpD
MLTIQSTFRPLRCCVYGDKNSPSMRHRSNRNSLASDSLLALFTLGVTAVCLALFQRMFSWEATFAVLLVPILLLCRHLRFRAAAVASAVALLAGAWVIVPPRWSFRIEMAGVPAVLIFACAATLVIAVTIRASERRRRVHTPLITPVPEPHQV